MKKSEELQMAETQIFELWLEFEQYDPKQDYDPTDDFANIGVDLPDGRTYNINVWTFGFLRRARFPWPYEEGVGDPDEYVIAPDLFVERLDRPTLERVVRHMLANGGMREEWLSRNEEPVEENSDINVI